MAHPSQALWPACARVPMAEVLVIAVGLAPEMMDRSEEALEAVKDVLKVCSRLLQEVALLAEVLRASGGDVPGGDGIAALEERRRELCEAVAGQRRALLVWRYEEDGVRAFVEGLSVGEDGRLRRTVVLRRESLEAETGFKNEGRRVGAVTIKSIADGLLFTGDVIVTVDGAEVSDEPLSTPSSRSRRCCSLWWLAGWCCRRQ